MQTDTIVERAKAKDPKALNEIYAMYYQNGWCVHENRKGRRGHGTRPCP